MTCPTITSGSISTQAGIVSGWTSAFVDAYCDRQGLIGQPGVNSQFQYPIILTDKSGGGTRYQQNSIVKGEHQLLFAFIGARFDSNALPFPAADSGHALGTEWNDGAGNIYKWNAVTFMSKSTKNCNSSDSTASSGTLTIISMNEYLVEGSYDLYFGSDHITGTYSALRASVAGSLDFTGCPTRPSSSTCISA